MSGRSTQPIDSLQPRLDSVPTGARLVRQQQRPSIVIVEPDVDVKLLVVVTVYEVSE